MFATFLGGSVYGQEMAGEWRGAIQGRSVSLPLVHLGADGGIWGHTEMPLVLRRGE